MANNTLIVTLLDGSSVSLALATSDYPAARAAAQQLTAGPGFWSDDGSWHSSSAVVSIEIS